MVQIALIITGIVLAGLYMTASAIVIINLYKEVMKNQNEKKLKIMKVRFKKLSAEAVMPKKAHPADAGLDLTCTRREVDEFGNIVYHTDIAVEIPDGCVGLLFPRSSNCKKDLWLTNSIGVIDSNYRGEVTFKYRPIDTYATDYLEDDKCSIARINTGHIYEAGDRVGQLVVIPILDVVVNEVEELTENRQRRGWLWFNR